MKGIINGIVMFCLFIAGEYMIDKAMTVAEISGKIK